MFINLPYGADPMPLFRRFCREVKGDYVGVVSPDGITFHLCAVPQENETLIIVLGFEKQWTNAETCFVLVEGVGFKVPGRGRQALEKNMEKLASVLKEVLVRYHFHLVNAASSRADKEAMKVISFIRKDKDLSRYYTLPPVFLFLSEGVFKGLWISAITQIQPAGDKLEVEFRPLVFASPPGFAAFRTAPFLRAVTEKNTLAEHLISKALMRAKSIDEAKRMFLEVAERYGGRKFDEELIEKSIKNILQRASFGVSPLEKEIIPLFLEFLAGHATEILPAVERAREGEEAVEIFISEE